MIVRVVLACLRKGFALADVTLDIDVPAGLPAVRTDVDRAPRSLTSLLFHARKFRKGGPVRLRARRGKGAVEFAISYDGIALSPDAAAARLALFYPALPRKDQQLAAPGLGLGLIAAVMARSDGRLSFTVSPEGRAELLLSLPEAV